MGKTSIAWRKKLAAGLTLVVVLVLVWSGTLYYQIAAVGEEEELVEADVILVLGAAVWPSGPSPALQARVFRAVELFREGYAPYLLMSGGLGEHPPAEAAVMAQAARDLGVPGEAILLEPRASSTAENMAYCRAIMENQGWETALVVTDAFHMKRALRLAADEGITAYPAPAKNSVLYVNSRLRFLYTWREVAALSQYYLGNIWSQG